VPISLHLKVFVSGKEHELELERKAAKFIIKTLGLEFVGSEVRAPSENSMHEANTEEVLQSDIYIGIIGAVYSKPTIDEFITARGNGIPVLVYSKNLEDPKQRSPELIQFLDEIKDPNTGIVVGRFKDAVDLQESMAESLPKTIEDRFRKARRLITEKNQRQTTKVSKELTAVYDIEAPKGDDLGRVKIMELRLPEKIEKGKELELSAKIKGEGKYLFLDLLIVDPDGNKYWFPDLGSWDAILDRGKKTLTNEEYSASWKFIIPESSKNGNYIIFFAVYEDTYYLPTANRRLIAYDKREVEIT
jgi:hypothetical protein